MHTVFDCGCGNAGDCECEEISGLGFVEPMSASFFVESAGAISGTILNAFQSAYSKLEDFFDIGQGRKDADIIVPLQNEIGARLAEIVAARPYSTIFQLQNHLGELNALKFEFLQFIQDPRLTADGDTRATDQAYEDIIPLIDAIARDTANRIIQLGGTPQPPQLTLYSGSSYPPGRLEYPSQTTFPAIPQAGTIWPNTSLSTVRSNTQPVAQASLTSLLPVLIGGAALFFLGRR